MNFILAIMPGMRVPVRLGQVTIEPIMLPQTVTIVEVSTRATRQRDEE